MAVESSSSEHIPEGTSSESLFSPFQDQSSVVRQYLCREDFRLAGVTLYSYASDLDAQLPSFE